MWLVTHSPFIEFVIQLPGLKNRSVITGRWFGSLSLHKAWLCPVGQPAGENFGGLYFQPKACYTCLGLGSYSVGILNLVVADAFLLPSKVPAGDYLPAVICFTKIIWF